MGAQQSLSVTVLFDCPAISIRLSPEIGDRLALVIVIGAKQDQLALDHVLCLKPEPGWAALVRAERPLRDNALQANGAGMLEQFGPLALIMVAELDGAAGVHGDDLAQLVPPLEQRFVSRDAISAISCARNPTPPC
jgi:hypothetical protein